MSAPENPENPENTQAAPPPPPPPPPTDPGIDPVTGVGPVTGADPMAGIDPMAGVDPAPEAGGPAFAEGAVPSPGVGQDAGTWTYAAAGATDAGIDDSSSSTPPNGGHQNGATANGGNNNGGSSRGSAATKARIATVAAGLLGIVVGAGTMALLDGDDADFRDGMQAGNRGPGMSNARGGQRQPGDDAYPYSDGDGDGRFPGHDQDDRGGSQNQAPQFGDQDDRGGSQNQAPQFGDQDDQGQFMPPSGGSPHGRSGAS